MQRHFFGVALGWLIFAKIMAKSYQQRIDITKIITTLKLDPKGGDARKVRINVEIIPLLMLSALERFQFYVNLGLIWVCNYTILLKKTLAKDEIETDKTF